LGDNRAKKDIQNVGEYLVLMRIIRETSTLQSVKLYSHVPSQKRSTKTRDMMVVQHRENCWCVIMIILLKGRDFLTENHIHTIFYLNPYFICTLINFVVLAL